MESSNDNVEQLEIISSEIVSATNDCIVFIAILTPSLSFIMFIYWPAFLVYIAYCRHKFGEYNGEQVVTIVLAVRHSALILFGTIIFYLLQKRELKRFLTQQDLVKKEQIASRKE